MNNDRQFWSNQPRKRPANQCSMTMKLIQQPDDQFELVMGAVRLTLTPSELLKMRTLLNRGAQMYKDSLSQDV